MEERRTILHSTGARVLMVLAALLATPFLLIGAAFLEENVLHTMKLENAYRRLGILDLLGWLYENTIGLFF